MHDGFAWNPLTGFPRNKPCMCGSLKKFKLCCAPKIPEAIPSTDAEFLTKNWSRLLTGDLKLAHGS